MKSVELSIIVTAHAEGLLAHKTMLSLLAATKELDAAKVSYEILIHLDNATPETKACFARYQKQPNFRLFENSFGDSGSSRNFTIKQAKGNYISILDGDDLISKNWLIESFKKVSASDKPIIVHPEANLTFGLQLDHQVLWLQRDSFDKQTDALLSVATNRWTSACTGLRQIFLDHPYPKNGDGYGNEDYYFNTETLAHDIRHEVAKNTVQFYRRKTEHSVFAANFGAVQPYSDLLDIDFFKTFTFDGSPNTPSRTSLYQKASRAYRSLKKQPVLDKALTPLAYNTVRVINRIRRSHVTAPDFVLDAWREAGQIEAALYPTEQALSTLELYDSESDSAPGLCYYDLVKNIPALPNYIFIVPWVVPGGADKVLLNYLKAFAELHPRWRIAVITTLPSDNGWIDRLPKNAYHLDFGNISLGCKPADRDRLFSRLIVQLKCKKLHIINSEHGYNWAAAHKPLIKKHYTLNVSLFCHDVIPGTNAEGIFDYADPYLLEIFPLVNKVYTDNQAVIDRTATLDAFDPAKFVVHYQPDETPLSAPTVKPKLPDGKFHILWASRIAAQKNPELLKEIAKQLSPSKYQIDVYGRIDGEYNQNFFADVPTIKYHGAYDGITSLNPQDFHLFLYTSLIDGLPNILLEVAALGLPIITSDAGGVKEFIQDGKTGRLVTENNPELYAQAIREAVKSPELYQEYAVNAQKLLEKRHSFSAYLKKVSEDL